MNAEAPRPDDRPLVYDGHCHVASTDFIPRRFIEDVAANVHRALDARGAAPSLTRLVDGYLAQHQDHDADRLVAEMDAAGIARSVLLVPDFSLRMDSELTLEEMARRHHAIRSRHPGRFWVFIGADPRHGPDGIKLFERCLDEYGFEGLKLYPPCGYSPSDPSLDPYYEICAARALPVFVHTGPSACSLDFEPAHPLLIDAAARAFPGVDFILGHGAVTYLDLCADLARHRPNLYLDLGGFSGGRYADGWPRHLNRAFRLGLDDKLLFGTDWPLGRMSGGLDQLVHEVVSGPEAFAGIRRRERDLILSGNLARLLARRGAAV